jgi:predicted transcriptional regulator
MKNKYYNLTEKPNNNVKDTTPEWMDKFFEDRLTTAEKEKVDYPKDSKDWIHPVDKSTKIHKCSICGTPLSSNEVGVCSKCSK